MNITSVLLAHNQKALLSAVAYELVHIYTMYTGVCTVLCTAGWSALSCSLLLLEYPVKYMLCVSPQDHGWWVPQPEAAP